MEGDIKEISRIVEKESLFVRQIEEEIGKVIVGQKDIIERLVIGLVANGHVLIEGVPGLAKTLTIKTLSEIVQSKFQRIQFTPDLLPADLIGTIIYNPQGHEFTTKKGPLFANLILADEINRAPAKVQSALLEAMQEHQVTIGENTYLLDDPFMVMATQNPIEQEGTYPLPEAQVDRFMLKLRITYPKREEEQRILERMTTGQTFTVNRVITPSDIVRVRSIIPKIYMDDKVKNYILDIVFATRFPEKFKLESLKPLIAYGGSPRATIYLALAAKAHAFIRGRGYVTPDDIKAIGMDVLRHRVIITYEAEAEEMNSENIIQKIFDGIEVP
ncbi:MAG: MoxR family ATPase [Candidatus Eremiobacteraeota bacterium]|nr:MoxR family ATPase [Candidatus Eremiobacteraeota bacterium]